MHATVVVVLFLGSILFGAGTSFGIAAAAWLLRSAILLAQQPEDNKGHRAGGKGFDSEHRTYFLAMYKDVTAILIPRRMPHPRTSCLLRHPPVVVGAWNRHQSYVQAKHTCTGFCSA